MISDTDLKDILTGDVRATAGDGRELAQEVVRLRTALRNIAEKWCETPIGFQAEYALMTDEQRKAIDAARSTPMKRADSEDK